MNNFGVVELAGPKATHTPGWAYVPDTGANPASFQPSSRKRATRERANLGLSDLSARQETKIRKELEALDRDNPRDVTITIPPKSGGSRSQNKHTPNVRKILQSQKTFANHLDDYQAMLALAESNPSAAPGANVHFPSRAAMAAAASSSPVAHPPAATSGSGSSSRIKRSGSAQKAAASSSSKSRRRTSATSTRAAAAAGDPEDVEMPDADTAATPTGQATDPSQQEQQAPATTTASTEAVESLPTEYPPDGTILPPYRKPPPRKHAGDADPLLVSRVPPFPSDDELRALMTAPPLSYLEVRARWPEDGQEEAGAPRRYPARRFCEVCGYWGRVRCTKCGTGVCALDCLEVHREDCVTRYGL